jgi:hypothetical protein
MSHTSRIEIEARLFVFTCLGEMKQSGQLVQAVADHPQLLADLLHLYPLERWHEQGLITREQLAGWVAQALTLLTSSDRGSQE